MTKNYGSDVEALDDLVAKYGQLRNEIGKVIIGQDEVVRDVLISIFSQSLHCSGAYFAILNRSAACEKYISFIYNFDEYGFIIIFKRKIEIVSLLKFLEN